jgi:PD-(D/E)XK endonuclease
VLTTDQKGAIAEAVVTAVAIKLGVGVYKPVFEGGRYDLILDLGERLLRVQCKWAPRDGDVVLIRCRSCRRAREGLRYRGYTAAEVDAIAAYCPQLDRCYLIPPVLFDGRKQLYLRLAPSRNNQKAGVNWASDFDYEARLMALLGP